MSGIKHILAATDFSERAAWAERRAAVLSALHRCVTTELLTVVEVAQSEGLAHIVNKSPEDLKSDIAESVLRELQARSNEISKDFDVRFTCTVGFGPSAREIAKRSEDVLADLIVIGANGGNFFTDLFLGNTADKLLRRCKRPLLIVKNDPVFNYRHILVPVDFSEDSRQAAQLALQIDPEAMLTFIHAYEVPFVGKMQYAGVSQDAIDLYRIKGRDDARLALNRFINELNVPERRTTRHFEPGHPGAVVRDYAEKMRPDLIVMGKRGRCWIEEWIVGSVTRDTIDWTKCDIAVIPPLQESIMPDA